MVLFFATLGCSGDIALCYTQDHILDVSLEVHNSRIIMYGLLHIAWPCNLCYAYKHRSAGSPGTCPGWPGPGTAHGAHLGFSKNEEAILTALPIADFF